MPESDLINLGAYINFELGSSNSGWTQVSKFLLKRTKFSVHGIEFWRRIIIARNISAVTVVHTSLNALKSSLFLSLKIALR